MKSKLAWLLVPLFGVVLWLALRDRAGTTAPPSRSALPVEGGRSVTVLASGEPSTMPAAPPTQSPPPGGPADPMRSPVGSPGSGARSGSARPTSVVPGSVPTAPPGTASTLPPPQEVDPDAPAGKFTDRTGWSDTSVAKQLNKEFMPLASECIGQAQARNPKLVGMLGYAVIIAPTEKGKVIVSSLKLLPTNEINDPELFECIRESSFSLEGLTAPHDFSITMPIHPDGRD